MISFSALNLDGTSNYAELVSESNMWVFYNRETGEKEEHDVAKWDLKGWLQEAERATIHLEDVILVILPQGRVVAFDSFMGTVMYDRWTQEQIVAVVTLALLGDEIPQAASLYEIAEPLFDDWPQGCRCIP